MKEKLMKYKKKIIVTTVSVVTGALVIVGGYVGMGYYYAKQNENFSEAEVKEIALTQVDGDVISVHKEFELEDDRLSLSEFEYDIEIKTTDYKLQEVTVSARTGTIEIENDMHGYDRD